MAKQILGQPDSCTNITVSGADYANGLGLLYVGTSGDIYVDGYRSGVNVKFANHPVGILPVLVTKVYSGGTTADDLVFLEGVTENRG